MRPDGHGAIESTASALPPFWRSAVLAAQHCVRSKPVACLTFIACKTLAMNVCRQRWLFPHW